MKECPNCAVEIEDRATVCPICRYDFPARAALPWKPVAILLLVVILVPLIWGAIRLLRGS